MAKTKYEGQKTCRKAFKMARDEGLNDKEIAHNLGISESCYYEWLKKHKEFSESIKKGRELSIDKVENALFKEAIGYWVEETKTYIQKGRDGEKTTRVEKVKKFIRPNVTSQIFALKNKRALYWKDRPEDYDDSGREPLRILAEVIKRSENGTDT